MSAIRRTLSWFPRGVRLSDAEFDRRHGTLTALLLLQLPVLLAFGLYRGGELVPLLLELAFPLVAGVVGWSGGVRRRIRSFAVTAGLIYLSAALVHLSGGAAEASLHYLVMLSFIALYQDWAPFGWAIGFSGVSHLVLSWTGGTAGVTGAGVATGAPDLDVAPLLGAVLVASIGQLLGWKAAERQEAQTVAARDAVEEQEVEAARRDAYAKMYVNLARRGQSLIERQVGVIDRLEREVEDPDVLADVFELDHLTTRVRRHGESLLVVAGVDLPTFSNAPVALVDVLRGAQSEVEHYRRVDVRVDGTVAVEGPVVRDLRHLVAELLENATSFSAPTTTVEVEARAEGDGRVVLSVVDHGIGFDDGRRAQVNEALCNVEHLDEDSVRHLGLRVVARLASKHGIEVELGATPGGGTTAWVVLPEAVVSGAEGLAALRPQTPPSLSSEPVLPAVAPAEAPTPTAAPVPSAVDDVTAPLFASEPDPVVAATDPAVERPAESAASAADAIAEATFAAAAEAAPARPPLPTTTDDATAGEPVRAEPAPAPAPAPAAPSPEPDHAVEHVAEAAPSEAPADDTPAAALLAQGSFSARRGSSRRSSRRGRRSGGRRAAPTPTPPAPPDVPAPTAGEVPPAPDVVPWTHAVGEDDVLAAGVGAATDHDAPPLPRRTPAAQQAPASRTRAPIIGSAARGHVPAASIAEDEAAPPPPLPRRERGATTRAAEEEALDLFGQLDAGPTRSSLSSFQQGQRQAREGDR